MWSLFNPSFTVLGTDPADNLEKVSYIFRAFQKTFCFTSKAEHLFGLVLSRDRCERSEVMPKIAAVYKEHAHR